MEDDVHENWSLFLVSGDVAGSGFGADHETLYVYITYQPRL